MTIWQTLNIKPTHDQALIKKAYRILLKECHPEEDPEGFKRIREAYESALDQSRKSPAKFTDIELFPISEIEISETDNTYQIPEAAMITSDNESFSPQDLATEFASLINDACLRNQESIWQTWLQKVQLTTLSNQQEISTIVLQDVIDKSWLPSQLVKLFWHGLGWNLLKRGNEEEQQIATDLEYRIKTTDVLSLEALSIMPHGEQILVLRFTQMLQEMLHATAPHALRAFLRTMSVHSIQRDPRYHILLLKAYRAADIWPQYTLISALESLITSVNTLSADDLILASEVCRQIYQPELFQLFIRQMLACHLDTEVAEQMYQWHYGDDLDLSLGFANLYHQQRPQIPAFWLLHRHWAKPQSDSALECRREWLYNQLINQEMSHSKYLHQYQFTDTTPAEQMLSGLWTAIYGSWKTLREWQPIQVDTNTQHAWSWNILLQLLSHWVQHTLNQTEIPLSLYEKLVHYDTDQWYQSAGFTQSELHTLEINAFTPEQWMSFYRRHPMMPQRWFHALVQAEIFTHERFDEDPFLLSYQHQLAYWRSLSGDAFELESPWEGMIFKGSFEWSILFYTQLNEFQFHLSAKKAPNLPELLKTTLLGSCQSFIESAETIKLHLLPDHLLESDHAVINSIYDHQILLMSDQAPIHQLMTGFHENKIPELLALTLKIKDSLFHESILLFNLVRSHNIPALGTAMLIVFNRLKQTRKNLELEKNDDEYDCNTIELVHSFLYERDSKVKTVSDLNLLRPTDEMKPFYYPMVLLCSILSQQEAALSEVNLEAFKPLLSEDVLNPTQQQIAGYGLELLNKKIQTQIQHDKDNKTLKTYSLKNLRRAGVLTGFACYLSDGHFHIIMLALLLTIIHGCFILRLFKTTPGRIIYISITTLLMYWGLVFNGFGSGLAMLSWHIIAVNCISSMRINGFWENSNFNKEGKFDLLMAIQK